MAIGSPVNWFPNRRRRAAREARPPPSIWEQKKACVRGELSGSVKGLVGNFGGNHGFSGVYPINPLVKAEWEFPAICQKNSSGILCSEGWRSDEDYTIPPTSSLTLRIIHF